jgi:anti-sigma B factor antagonist
VSEVETSATLVGPLVQPRDRRAMSEPLSLTAKSLDGRGHLVTVAGEIDISDAPELAEYLVHFEDGDITVDLSGVTFIDSSGIRALLAARKRIEQEGSTLTIRGASGRVLRVFQIAGLDHVLNVDGDA